MFQFLFELQLLLMRKAVFNLSLPRWMCWYFSILETIRFFVTVLVLTHITADHSAAAVRHEPGGFMAQHVKGEG